MKLVAEHTAQYTIPEINLSDIYTYGVRVPVEVIGYWSSDVIILRLRREDCRPFAERYAQPDVVPPPEQLWFAELSHSSGGRDRQAVADDLEAEANFGAALQRVAQLGRELLGRVGELEAAWQDAFRRREAERAAEQAAKDAAVETDAPLGAAKAAALVAEVRATIGDTFKSKKIHAVRRGLSDIYFDTFEAYGTAAGLRWRCNGASKTAAQVAEALAAASHRTAIVEV